MEDNKVRLQKFLANSGVASRRKCEELILEGKVSVNGKVVNELGIKIDPTVDKVEYCGKSIHNTEKLVYILLNKPIGYVTTANDQFNRDTVLDLVKVYYELPEDVEVNSYLDYVKYATYIEKIEE